MKLLGVKGGRTERVGIGVQCPIEASGSKSVSLVHPSLACLANISVRPKRKLFGFSGEALLSPGNLEGS